MGLSGSTGCAKNEPLPSQFVPSMVTKQSYFRSECNARAIVVFIIIIIIILFARKIQICFTHDSTRAGQTRLLSSYSCPRKKRQQKRRRLNMAAIILERSHAANIHTLLSLVLHHPSLLYSRLKTLRFCKKILHTVAFLSCSGLITWILKTVYFTSEHICCYFLVFFLFYTFQLSHVKIASRIVSYLHAEVNDIKIAIVTP